MGFTPKSRERDLTAETNLTMPAGPVAPVADGTPPQPSQPEQVSRATVWLHRISLVIFVMFCVELGLLLTVLPWTQVWTNNSLLALHPTLKAVLQDNFVRGVITGLGLVDVWIGIWEAVHYKDPGKRK
jgi:hypothetical protein